MEARISVLETRYGHIETQVEELREDVKATRQEMKSEFGEVRKTLESMNLGRIWDRVWMLLSIGAVLGVMARGFKWI